MLAVSLAIIPIPAETWDLAADYCGRQDINVRAGDAVHIAVAQLGGHSLATLDNGMADAAGALNVAVETIPPL